MKYRELFAKLDSAANRLALAQTELDTALNLLRQIKSGLWNADYKNGEAEVKEKNDAEQK